MEFDRQSSTLTAYVTGELDHCSAPQIRRELDRMISEPGIRHLVLDLSGMTFMEHLEDNIRTYSPLEELTEEEQEARRQQFLDQATEEEREAYAKARGFMSFTGFGKQDMPEGTIITDAYYSDMLVPVALRSFVDFLQTMTAGGN